METSKEWTDNEKLIARFIRWGIILSVVLIIVGGSWTAIELLLNPSASSFGAWFMAQDWTIQVLVIGALIVGVLVAVVLFSIFIRRGQKFLLNLLFKIED